MPAGVLLMFLVGYAAFAIVIVHQNWYKLFTTLWTKLSEYDILLWRSIIFKSKSKYLGSTKTRSLVAMGNQVLVEKSNRRSRPCYDIHNKSKIVINKPDKSDENAGVTDKQETRVWSICHPSYSSFFSVPLVWQIKRILLLGISTPQRCPKLRPMMGRS